MCIPKYFQAFGPEDHTIEGLWAILSLRVKVQVALIYGFWYLKRPKSLITLSTWTLKESFQLTCENTIPEGFSLHVSISCITLNPIVAKAPALPSTARPHYEAWRQPGILYPQGFSCF